MHKQKSNNNNNNNNNSGGKMKQVSIDNETTQNFVQNRARWTR